MKMEKRISVGFTWLSILIMTLCLITMFICATVVLLMLYPYMFLGWGVLGMICIYFYAEMCRKQ